MKKQIEVTCRYGVTYTATFNGTIEAIKRTIDHCKKCCCWTCFNTYCKEPRNEKINKCGNVCEIWTKNHYCKNYIN